MKTVTVFGGSGFVGRYVVEKLAKSGWYVKVAVRHPSQARTLSPLGNIGQIIPIEASILDYEQVQAAIAGSDAVINLVGILFERGQQTFQNVHIQGADNVAGAAKKAKIKRLIHMSALGACESNPARYAWSKALGEAHVRKHFPKATLIRPSVIFGPEDDFFNRFAAMAIFSPALPLVGGGETKFQPVYVCDVADFFVRALADPTTLGKTFELGGPKVYTFKELIEYTLKTIGRRRLLVSLPYGMARMMGQVGQYFPKPPLTPDQVLLLKTDTVVSSNSKGLEALGVAATSLETIVPDYLERYRAIRSSRG